MTFLRASKGFTLVEVLLALGITALIASLLTTVTFQIVKGNVRINNRLLVVNDLQNAAKWLYLDGEKAQTTDLIDGGETANTMRLNWTSGVTAHQSDYSLSGTELTRTHNGSVISAARNVTEVDFSLVGRLITVNLTSSSGNGDVTKQATYLIHLRSSE